MILAAIDEECPQLVVVDFQQERSEPHHFYDLQNAVVFGYPEFHTKCLGIDIRVDPWRPNPKLQAPFHRDTSHVLFAVTLWINMGNDSMQCLIQFLPSDSLTSLIKNETLPFQYYGWESWGLHGSRLLFPSTKHFHFRNSFVHGWKYATLEDDDDASQDGVVARLYDFNQVTIKRNYRDTEDKGTCADVDRWVYNSAGTSVVPGVFKYPVETTLPYRSQELFLKDVHDQCLVHCTEDHIIIVDVSFPEKKITLNVCKC